MTNKSQIDPEHLSFNSLRILRFCHLNMFKERHTYYPLFSELWFTCVIISVFQCLCFCFSKRVQIQERLFLQCKLFDKKILKKFKVFFRPLFKAKRINKLAQKSVRKKLIEKIPNKAETHHSITVGVVRCCEIVVVRNR